MHYGAVAGIDKPISRLVQGTMMVRSDAVEQSFQLLDDVFALGCTTFDTAHGYGQGDCERTFGRWLAARGLREQVVILGKGAHHNQDRQRVTPFDITSDLHDSLARLQTDYIDLYLLHRDDPTVPVGPIVEILNEHRAAGRIRAFGGSNWRWTRIAAANEYAHAHGLTPFVASSSHFSLAIQFQEPWPNCVTVTGAVGSDCSFTEKVAVPPASVVVRPLAGATTTPAPSSSMIVTVAVLVAPNAAPPAPSPRSTPRRVRR